MFMTFSVILLEKQGSKGFQLACRPRNLAIAIEEELASCSDDEAPKTILFTWLA